MTTLTVADFADTGQWRLIVNIYTSGMTAFLDNTLHDDVEPQQLFSTRWEPDAETLLNNIENAVYDNPRMLDDFSARIILFDRRTLFIPTVLAEESEGAEEDYYTDLYHAAKEDVIIETDGDITAASSLAAGLKGFLSRTFPGARISSNLMAQVSRLRKENAGKGLMMSVTPREQEREADFILLDGSDLISASTHSVAAPEDIIYHTYNIIDSYGYNAADVEVPEAYRL